MRNKKMNKTAKAAVATAVGLGLLGAYGTFALWNDSAAVGGGSVQTGQFEVTSTGTSAWADISPTGVDGWKGDTALTGVSDAAAKPITIANFLMVPGDVIEMTKDVTVIATGDNMKAKLTINPGTGAVPPALASNVTFAAVVKDSGGTEVTGTGVDPLVFDINPTAAAGKTYTVEVRVGFKGSTPDRVGVGQAINLSGLSFDLDQVRPS